MSHTDPAHLSKSDIASLIAGDRETAARAIGHLRTCGDCRDLMVQSIAPTLEPEMAGLWANALLGALKEAHHPDEDDLRLFAEASLETTLSDAIGLHVVQCDSCRSLVQAWREAKALDWERVLEQSMAEESMRAAIQVPATGARRPAAELAEAFRVLVSGAIASLQPVRWQPVASFSSSADTEGGSESVEFPHEAEVAGSVSFHETAALLALESVAWRPGQMLLIRLSGLSGWEWISPAPVVEDVRPSATVPIPVHDSEPFGIEVGLCADEPDLAEMSESLEEFWRLVEQEPIALATWRAWCLAHAESSEPLRTENVRWIVERLGEG